MPDLVLAPTPPRTAALPDAAHALLDDPAEWPAFGRRLETGPAAGCWESQLAVEGMRCASCAFAIEDAVGRLAGVREVAVDAARQRARVVWSPAQTRPSRWFGAAAAAGYTLVPAGDLSLRARRARSARLALWRWLVAGLCMMQVMMYAYPAYIAAPGEMSADAVQLMRWASWVLTLPVVLFSCQPFFASAWRDLRARRIGMDLPVALGMAITFAVSSVATFDPGGPLGGEVYFDSLTMFVFFLLTGRWLEQRLLERTAGALDALANRLPDSIERRDADGRFVRVALRRLARGDVVRVLPGEVFPADGVVLDGDTAVAEAMLTGESRALPRGQGDRVLAGAHNLYSPVTVRIELVGEGTRFAQIVALMAQAATHRPRLARLADRVARPFLLAVLAAAGLALAAWWPSDPARALMAAVAVLIVTCPCALSLATPAAVLASAGRLAGSGVVVRDLQALEALAGIDTVLLDKTGTLSADVPRLQRVYCRQGLRPGDALELAAALGAHSLHPAARALVAAWQAQFRAAPGWEVRQLTEHGGQGIEGELGRAGQVGRVGGEGRRLRLGAAAFCGVAPLEVDAPQLHLSDAQGWVASFVLAEELRPDAAQAVQALAAQGVAVQLLSGDREASAQSLAAQAGIAVAHGDCSPEDKLQRLQALQARGHRVAMVGDGLNDGPVLARADASFAFGQAVPLAQARADYVVLGDALMRIPQTLLQARRTMRIVRQNLCWAATYNAVCVPLAIAGWLPAWLAGLGMAASSLLVVLNASRLAKGGA